ncbi:restriction endonuclease subunit S [Cellulophaga sp. Asnod2-G02]|uniref:restriction endonuclease subunit S n=1 Tax=Cellulophaga sp. Asnod2-G02 TaxID=3160572 RepID=UPI003868AD26
MPKNWKTYKLSEIVDQNRGISYGIVQPGKHDLNGIPILKVNNLTNKSFDLKDLHFVSKKVESKYKRTRLTGGEILLSLVGTLGEVFIVPENLVGLNVVRALAVIPVIDKYSPIWVEYYLKSPKIQDRLKQIATTSVQATINLKELREVEILLPEIKEREAIASILSALDDKIENNLAMNKTLEEMTMALYKHWFVDFGPFKEGKFIDSELGEIPEGWEVKELGEIYNTTSGGTPSRKIMEYYENGTIPWVKSKELYGNFIVQTEEKITELGLSKSSAKLVPKKTVMLAMYGATVGESSILSSEASCNQAICAIMQKEISYVYIFQFLRFFKNDILNQAVGSAQQNISQAIIKNLKIIAPPSNLEVFEKIELLYSKAEKNLIENQTLTQLRDTLLPKLISGEVRLKEFEEEITAAL